MTDMTYMTLDTVIDFLSIVSIKIIEIYILRGICLCDKKLIL